MEQPVNKHPETEKPMPCIPGQQAAMTWEKSDAEGSDPRPSPPLWTRYMNSRLKEFCKR